MARRSASAGAVIVDLRAPSLFALGKARYRGRALLALAVERLVADRMPVRLIVATPPHRREVTAALGLLAAGVRVDTSEEFAAARADLDHAGIIWLRSFVLGLDAADVARLCAERAAGLGASVRVICAVAARAGLGDALPAGWIVAASELPHLLDAGTPRQARKARPPSLVERPTLTDLEDFAALLRSERRRRAEQLLLQGVELADWPSLEIDGDLECAAGVVIGAHVTVEGRVELGRGARIGAYTFLRNVRVGADTEVKAFSSLEDVEIGANCRVGPYARLRAQTIVDSGVSIGNFVELKATQVGSGGRINHFAFLGDAVLEPDVTIGAGVITCNHDGAKAQPTRIESGAYVGSGTELIAPLVVGRDSTIGAGSTITENVQPGGLTLARARQVRVAAWKRKGGK